MNVPDLRSPHDKVGGIFYFGRMLDKIRLHAREKLPEDYQKNLGRGFDERCVNFLWIEYPALVEQVKRNDASDEEILEWCFAQGRKLSDEEIEIWNDFMRKRGWNDEVSAILERRKKEGGFAERDDVETMFDFIDLDEGRDPRERA